MTTKSKSFFLRAAMTLLVMLLATVSAGAQTTEYIQACLGAGNDGSDEHPYTISDADGWNAFCDALEDNTTWNRFIGKTVKLGNSIEVTRMAGGSKHDFCGTFDGQGHTLTFNYGKANDVSTESYIAPFRNAESGCIIENLHVAGDIYTSGQFAAGIVCSQYGSVIIRNCRSSINIHSSHSGDGTHGGIVANNNTSASLTIEGCLFDGKILTTGATATSHCGGFVGWRNNAVTISNSLYAPAALEDGETEVIDGNSYPIATFCRNGATISNSYYTRTLGDAQGEQSHCITAGDNASIAFSGTATEYTVSGITAYKDGETQLPGLKYGDVLYAGNDDDVSLTLSAGEAPFGYQYDGFAASAGTLTGTENPYTLTMSDADVTISANYEPLSDGTCGTGVYYWYDNTSKTLRIFGTGAMNNGQPWSSYKADITTVIIEDGVRSIGNKAFYECTSLASITIPARVTSIGNQAFERCTSLTSIEIPTSVTSIGNDAFYNCKGLTSVTIPNSVTKIGIEVFGGCISLTSVTIPTSVTSIGDYAFAGCTGLTGIEIPTRVTSIGNSAFSSCRNLTSVTIPTSVTSIGDYAFAGCTGLTGIEIPTRVTSIGNYAFNGCRALTGIEIPASVTSIGYNAFSGCSALASILVASGNTVYDSRNNCNALIETASNTLILGCKNTIIPNDVTSIGNDAFYKCIGLTSVTIPASVTSIGERAFAGCTGLESMSVASGNTVYDSRNNCNAIIETATNKLIAGCKNTIIPNDVTSIGEEAFYECTGLTSVTIPNSVTSIGRNAFSFCFGLTSVTIPASVTTIGNYAFNDCTGLTSVTIPNSVTSIGARAFSGCTGLTSVTIYAPGLTEYGYGYRAFDDNAEGRKIYVYSGCVDTYKAGWSGYASDIVGFSGTCGTGVYYSYDSNRKTLNIFGTGAMEDYGAIYQPWYSNLGEIKTVIIEDGVTSIGDEAFYGCWALTSITIPNSVTSIGDEAFAGCEALTSIEIPNSVTSIGESAFYECDGLTSVTIPNSVTSIGDGAFECCTALTGIEIPASVTSIGERAFAGCTALASILVADGNTVYDSRNNCNALIETATNTLILGCKNTIIPNDVTSIGDAAFWGCSALSSINIPASVTSIGNLAFWDCTSLNSVTIYAPDLTEYGSQAFRYNASGRKIYVYSGCVETYKANAEIMGASADDILPIKDITLAANEVDGNYWTTFYCGHTGYEIVDDENACAYTATYDDENSELTLHKLGKEIPKNTAVIIVGEDNSISMTASDDDDDDDTVENDLRGCDVRTLKSELGEGTFYVLGKVSGDFGFFRYTGDYMPASKAYLLIDGDALSARGIRINFGEVNSIHNAECIMHNYAGANTWHDLQGRKLSAKPTAPGIYINNGKLVVVE